MLDWFPKKPDLAFFMLKYLTYSILAIGISTGMTAQKVMERSWDASVFERITIDGDAIFDIKVVASATSAIKLHVKAAGEYSDYVVLEISEEDRQLVISTGYSPYFFGANDKLAAHKVMSIELQLHIPEDLVVAVSSKLASFYGVGHFKHLSVLLLDGRCELWSFLGEASIKNRDGDILVYAKHGVVGTAKSGTGRVLNTLPNYGVHKINVQSVNGDITLALDR